jgi:hypothetical protein
MKLVGPFRWPELRENKLLTRPGLIAPSMGMLPAFSLSALIRLKRWYLNAFNGGKTR